MLRTNPARLLILGGQIPPGKQTPLLPIAAAAVKLKSAPALPDFIQKPLDRRIQLGRRLVRAGRNLRANFIDQLVANLPAFAGPDRGLGSRRNVDAVRRIRTWRVLSALSSEWSMRRVDTVRAVDMCCAVNLHGGAP